MPLSTLIVEYPLGLRVLFGVVNCDVAPKFYFNLASVILCSPLDTFAYLLCLLASVVLFSNTSMGLMDLKRRP